MKKGQFLEQIFAGLLGVFLGLSLVKFGNPPIMEKFVQSPSNIYEFLLGYPWPIGWAYTLLFLTAIAGLVVARWTTGLPKWLLLLPIGWLVWQYLAASRSVSTELSGPTCKHFTAAVVCFYLGLFPLAQVRRLKVFWTALFVGFALVLAAGWEQHFGGLAETRRYFFLYIYPTLKEVPPEYLKKISSDRIFSTLFYPNALAGAVVLLLPCMLAVVWRATGGGRFTPAARWFLVGLLALAAAGCLLWSGSKGGALLILMLAVIALLQFPLGRSLKIGVVAMVLLLGMAGFFWKYAAFFKKGATSVTARFDYWRAATQTALDKPVTGSGPGTFAIPYQALKRPESEMSRLVHNDYLEQASDSGLPGAAAYAGFLVFGLLYSRVGAPVLGKPHPVKPVARTEDDLVDFAVWLGLLGWAVQGFFEFGLYLPALAWPAFTLLGLRLGRTGNPLDNAKTAR